MAQNPYKTSLVDWQANNHGYDDLIGYPGIGWNPNLPIPKNGVMLDMPGFQGHEEQPGIMTRLPGYRGPMGMGTLNPVPASARTNLLHKAWEAARKKREAAAAVSPTEGLGGVAEAVSGNGGGGIWSKLGGLAKGMMPGSGTNINQMFGSKALQAGGKLAKIGALPGWSMPVAAAAAFQVNKRLGQKAHQKDLRKFEDQVRNMSTQQQYEMGLQKPEHNRRAGMLGRLFRR